MDYDGTEQLFGPKRDYDAINVKLIFEKKERDCGAINAYIRTVRELL